MEELPPCRIFIDKEGKWYHEGAEMIHREFIRLFYENLTLDPYGRYVIEWLGKRCQVEVEDTAYVVLSVEYKGGTGKDDSFLLTLSDDTREPLMPDALFVGRENVLYCRVKDRTFPARFHRPAYYQLAEYIEEENGTFVLPSHGRKFPITGAGSEDPERLT